jgi:hypothetical protein
MRNIITLVMLCAPLMVGQKQPEGAHVNLYFPHLADGGTVDQQWRTTFTFVNVGLVSSSCTLRTFNDSGAPLALDLGSGVKTVQEIIVPSGGLRILSSRVASSTIVSGWAISNCTAPVQATVAFRQIAGGTARQEITAQPTLPALDYVSAANPLLGVAIANVYIDAPISVDLVVLDSEGKALGSPARITVPPLGHTAFNLFQQFPGLPTNFQGVLAISGVDRPKDQFVAWTLNSDPGSGTLSALPPGAVSWPISHWDRIWLVFNQVVANAIHLGIIDSAPRLTILRDATMNARAIGGQTIEIGISLSQLISDSPSELAFILGHELGHIYQQRTRRLEFHTNPEFDADIWGTLLNLISAYDPYAAAGALAKLSMATGRAGLMSQFEDQLSGDAHASFNSRLASVYDALVVVCSQPSMKSSCDAYKSVIHPNFPISVPLTAPRTGSPEKTQILHGAH